MITGDEAVTIQAAERGNARRTSLREIQDDWKLLDSDHRNCASQPHTRLLSHEQFTPVDGFHVDYIPAGTCVHFLRFVPCLYSVAYAIRLLWRCRGDSVLIVNGGSSLWFSVGLLNRLLFHWRRRVLLWDIFVEMNRPWKKRIVQIAIQGIRLSVVWSKPQVATHAAYLGIPEDRFIFLPFKANHSKGPVYDLSIGAFIFSGGNGKRDYQTLINAVRDTGIPVVISATAQEVRNQIERLPNVIVLGAPEPAFAQLQAASSFVVIPMVHTGLKGGGEANFCNAMWHGKPIIAADSIAASDYILDGQTGYIVASGDAEALRMRILELWNDPDQRRRLGEAARRHVIQNFTHDKFIRRLLRLALVFADETGHSRT